MTQPHVAGVGLTPFGEHSERTGRGLFAEAGLAALDDAGVDPDDAEVGIPVAVDVGERETTGDRAVVFRPR
jgi:acetyl-CoA acetyltransferase